MTCPGPYSSSFKVCVQCGACNPALRDICRPDLLTTTQDILEHTSLIPGIETWQDLVQAVIP